MYILVINFTLTDSLNPTNTSQPMQYTPNLIQHRPPLDKPLNNYNPNLIKKPQHQTTPNNIRQGYVTYNNNNPNLFNRSNNRPNTSSGSSKGPIRIKNDKKPTTPDIHNGYRNISYAFTNNNNNNIYNVPNNKNIYQSQLPRPSSVQKRTSPSSHTTTNNRPSTAPHKDKPNPFMSNNSNSKTLFTRGNGIGYIDNSSNININKRLPSPQLHSNNSLSRTTKVSNSSSSNTKYRVPSPVIKSQNVIGGGTIKRGGGGFNKVGMF